MKEVTINGKSVKMHANLGAMVKMEQVSKTVNSQSEPLLHSIMCIYALILGADPKSDITPEYIQENTSAEEWKDMLDAYKYEMLTWNKKFSAEEDKDTSEQGNV